MNTPTSSSRPLKTRSSIERKGSIVPEARSQPRRSEILAIAARIFAEHGFEATTVRRISDAAGILSGSLYHHFDTKEEILHAIMRPFVKELRDRYEMFARSATPSDQILRAMLHFALTHMRCLPYECAIIFNDRKLFRRTAEFRYVHKTGLEISHVWYSVIFEGVRSGVFRDDLNVELTTTIIQKLVAVTADWYDPEEADGIEAMIDAQLNLILNGILS
jgi:TetR/AcrR family transcriptional regulator, cholesterol catabolism regulator